MAEKGEDEDGRGSRIMSFWTSLPGVLTGVAGVIAAAAALVPLFLDNEGTVSAPAGGSTVIEPTGSPRSGGGDCFRRYFEGIPRDRIAPVETGTRDFEVISATQPKAGTIGLRFTLNNRSIGAMRFGFFPTNGIFKIESIVDEQCRPIEDYANTTARGGAKNVLQNFDTVDFRIAGNSYSLRTGGGTSITIDFEAVVP